MATVYFSPISNSISQTAERLLKNFVESENITLSKDLLIKIHPGAIGNTAYNKPEVYQDILEYLKSKSINPSYVETCMESSTSQGKLQEFHEHGFNQLPIVIADGDNGKQHIQITYPEFKHLKYALISEKLATANQVLVLSHFKGHCMSGFGGTIKNLGIGFASANGKTLVHGIKDHFEPGDFTDWDKGHLEGESPKWVHNWDNKVLSSGSTFNERVAESALAAAKGKSQIYMNFAINIVNNCDCDGVALTPVYENLGILVSTDPVAIDKATFDLLEKQVGEMPFEGKEIFEYAQKIGLGLTDYHLQEFSY